MRQALSCALAVSAAAAFAAQPPPPQTTRIKTGGNPRQIVCINVEQIGSRLNRRRICRTRAEWEELQQQERQVVDRVQSFKPCPPVC